MEVLLTLTIQKRIKASDSDTYEEIRDELVERFEENGWSVDLQSEDEEEPSLEDEWAESEEIPTDMDLFSKDF